MDPLGLDELKRQRQRTVAQLEWLDRAIAQLEGGTTAATNAADEDAAAPAADQPTEAATANLFLPDVQSRAREESESWRFGCIGLTALGILLFLVLVFLLPYLIYGD
ncbi:MAG: hypothetical protein E1N59_946 [Puniceicoccaceae bacterium 5H]|nr:MAG: hypothetical protein E1N59_946 [Puniceicoccaceae bacterium 5H]